MIEPWIAESTANCDSALISALHGDKLYMTVTCVNGVELHTSVSGAVTVSFLPPAVNQAKANFIPENQRSPIYIASESNAQSVQSNSTCLRIGWEGFRDVSDIDRYEYRLKEDTHLIRDWSSSGLHDVVTVDGLKLSFNRHYTADVRAVNRAGYTSDVVSSAILVTDGPLLTGKFVSNIQRYNPEVLVSFGIRHHFF